MRLSLYDTTMASGNPGAGSLSGGPGPMQSVPKAEPVMRKVLDQTATAPAIVGKLLVRKYTDNGAANYAQNATASVALPFLGYGIVISPPTPMPGTADSGGGLVANVGGESWICCEGVCEALCTTGVTAIAAGTLLGADAAGNLTPIASPAAGEVLAIAIGALVASTSTATLVLVCVCSI